ncbi:Protein O-linked-mannose beta-1,4-N-acetylglucosaminyltransferase 2 [Hypsibius exemplaris]|uniref:Protein O-linked-mannose beta-1,4-N-acetylglucosaminyltransferase 2 n=1 Tax=Hypsibius exemplaris TaxID=2072580 RepID=A0A1W0WN53_HYPEX|nr:Protein O-linked-mannose beta-1,4-N-acetylglucosaminyltransferase 2 [Hypsibius exemplaris]
MTDNKEYSYTMLAKLLIVFLIVHLLAVITLILCFSSDHEVASAIVVPVSSVWCVGGPRLEQRRCYFRNLCYSFPHDEFVFVRGADSLVQGLPPTGGPLEAPTTERGVSPPAPPPGGNGDFSVSGGVKSDLRGGASVKSALGGGAKRSLRYRGEAVADLSGGVEAHGNTDFHFSYVEIPEAAIRGKNFTSSILPEKMLVFRRFKPDNLMHVLHDDLLPLWATLAELEYAGARDYRVFFADDHDEGDYWELYRVFRSRTHLNSHHPLVKRSLRAEVDKDADLVCFATATVGAVAHTKWYQYGYDRFQGPAADATITGSKIRAFAHFIRKGLEIPKYDIDMPRYGSRVRQKQPYAVLFNRRSDRLILNEVELSFAISREFNLSTVTVSLETHSLSGIIHLLENATMLIGMHGAQLALSMFLPRHSILLELFPYGLPAAHYTPYRTLAHLEGLDLIYRAWENPDPAKSHPHPEYPVHHGGFVLDATRKIPEQQQAEIVSNVPVKPHRCCKDPAFLFRMYQDTVVDLPGFIRTAWEAFTQRQERLKNRKTESSNATAATFSPAEVKNLNCSYRPGKGVFHVDWEEPWNRAFLGGATNGGEFRMRYLVRVQPAGATEYTEFESAETHLDVPAAEDGGGGLASGSGVHFWVAAVAAGDVVGPWTRRPVHCHR